MKVLSFFLFLLVFSSTFGQRFQQFIPSTYSLKSKMGILLAHRAKMSHLPKKNSTAFELELTNQDTSQSRWAQIYNGPVRGASVIYQDFGNKEVLGAGYTVFGHTSFPIIQGPKFGFLDFRLGAGFAWITKRYDLETNLKNNAIGSFLNGYVGLMFNWNKYYKHWHYGVGLEFAHYSNAALKVPNLGLNSPSIMFNLGYNIVPRKVFQKSAEPVHDEAYESRMADELRLIVVATSKQNPAKQLAPKSRPVIAIQGLYSMNVGKRWKVDFGLDFIYNDANRHYLDTSVYTIGETIQLGAFVGASIHFYRTEFFTGLGAYYWAPFRPFGLIYNRLGFRYHFTEKISGLVGIKAHLGIADYLEFGIGYQLWSKR